MNKSEKIRVFWNKAHKDYDYFKGQERILYKGESVFFQDVMGSLIK